MTDTVLVSKTVVIDLTESFEDSAEIILREHFPAKRDWRNQFTLMAGVVTELIEELWIPIQQILIKGGIDKSGLERSRQAVILVAWNQVLSDLFGSHTQVVARENCDE